jgi:F-type H+-transporting ATPase subunit delta
MKRKLDGTNVAARTMRLDEPSGKRGPISVENSAGITASLQGRYAAALFDLAYDQGLAWIVEGDMATLDAALASSADFAELIRSPKVSRTAATNTVAQLAGVLGLNDLTAKFLGVLAGNRRLGALPAITAAYASMAAAKRGEATAHVTSAHPLSAEQIDVLSAKLLAREGTASTITAIKIKATVNPELLGGLVVRVGSQQVDSSIRTRLNSLAQAMKG